VSVLYRVFTAVIEHHDQEQLGKERIYFILQLIVHQSEEELKAGTWRQELMQRLWRGAAYWLAPHGFFSLLSFFLSFFFF
jgi:hypothetical protein